MLGPTALPHPHETDIHEVLERVRKLVLAEVPQGVIIKRDYDISIPAIQADPDMLIQAILNIVRNAVQAMEHKGTILFKTRVERQFTIANRRHKLVARIDITDDGPGIPAEVMPHLFYPMVSSRAEGSGLGLSIAQSLINRHGGLIACESQPGKTTFTLLLPLETETPHG
jgi:two-component system nitrogen regulation sensor histidine kinase GlnL